MLKNSLARRVFADLGMDGLSKFLEGPSAVAWGGEGIAELAKEISTQVKTLKKPADQGGAVDGVVVGPEQVEDITKLPSREVLIGQVISLLLGPAQQTLSLLVVAGRARWSASSKPWSSGSKAKRARRRGAAAGAGRAGG